MRTIQLKGNNTALLYDSIHNMPEERYHEFNKYSLFDLGVGSDMESVNRHHETMDTYLKHGKNDEAIQERRNLHINYFYMIEKINTKSLCFGTFVYKINSEEVGGRITFESLKDTVSRLSKLGLKHGQVSDILEDIKKNLKQSLGLLSLEGMETTKN